MALYENEMNISYRLGTCVRGGSNTKPSLLYNSKIDL
jgi:hypothetical protein